MASRARVCKRACGSVASCGFADKVVRGSVASCGFADKVVRGSVASQTFVRKVVLGSQVSRVLADNVVLGSQVSRVLVALAAPGSVAVQALCSPKSAGKRVPHETILPARPKNAARTKRSCQLAEGSVGAARWMKQTGADQAARTTLLDLGALGLCGGGTPMVV